MRKLNKIIRSNTERMRMVVSRSNTNIYVQIIDDDKQITLLGLSSISLKKGRATVEVAKFLGQELAKKALDKGIKKVVFDRSDKKYHGRIKAVADGAREQGLDF